MPWKIKQTFMHVRALMKDNITGQDLSARSTHPIHHVEEQRHLMDHIISGSFQDQRSDFPVESLQRRCEFCWLHSTSNLLDDE